MSRIGKLTPSPTQDAISLPLPHPPPPSLTRDVIEHLGRTHAFLLDFIKFFYFFGSLAREVVISYAHHSS